MKRKLHLHAIFIAYCPIMDFTTPHEHTYHKFRVSFGQCISDKLLSLQFCHNLLYVLWFTAAGGCVVRVSEKNVNVTAGGGTCEGGAMAHTIVEGWNTLLVPHIIQLEGRHMQGLSATRHMHSIVD